MKDKIDFLRGWHISFDYWRNVYEATRWGVGMNTTTHDGIVRMILQRDY